MNIYIAGASKELPRVRAAMEAVRAAGHHVTFDWTAEVEKAGRPDHELHRDVLVHVARADINGAFDASVFWLLSPTAESAGAWTELGYALALRDSAHTRFIAGEEGGPRRIIVSGPRRSCFWTLADLAVDTDDEALASIRRLK